MDEIIKKKENKAAICRVCLNYDCFDSGKGFSLFEKYDSVFIYEKICYLSNIEIKEDDELPDRICSSCLLALDSACRFKQKCESSNAILHSAIRLDEPLHEQFIEVPIKEEIEEDFEYDYLDENALFPSELEESVDERQCNDKFFSEKHVPFKSKAIDLHLECDDCGEFFKSKCKLRVHWKKVHQPRQLTCPNCKKVLKTYKSFHSHMKRKSKSCMNASKLRIEGEGRNRIYYCKECNAHSHRMQTIMTHLVIHTGERPYVCNICEKTFTQHSSLIGHKEGTHKKYSKEGTCHQCGKHFKGRSNLYRHMRTHTKTEFPCTVCVKVLSSKGSWRVHMKRHSGIKSFACEKCAKTFYTSSDLANHRTKAHEKSKVYTCERCEYKTVNHSCMAKHRPKHSETNVACHVCGTFLENHQQLLLHKKRHFEKNLQCIYCKKMFYGRKNLSAHVRKLHNMYASCVKGKNANVIKVEVKRNSQSV